jgi:hypothetical protein
MVGITPALTAHEDSHVSGGTDEINSALTVAAMAVHGHAKHTDRTRRIWIGNASGAFSENCVQSSKGALETWNINSAVARIHGSIMVPRGYVSGGKLYVAYIGAGAAKTCNVLCDTPHPGELYNEGGGAGITSLTPVTNNTLYVLDMGFASLLGNIVADDVIGFYLDSDDANTCYIIGFFFEYLGDE